MHFILVFTLSQLKVDYNNTWQGCAEIAGIRNPVYTLKPRQNGSHFADDIFNRIFFKECVPILITFSVKFVSKGPVNNNSLLVQVMVCRLFGTKPLHEAMVHSSRIYTLSSRNELICHKDTDWGPAWVWTHWGRVTHICVGKTTIIGSYTGLSPGRRQDIIWTNSGILLIGTLGTNFSEILIECHSFFFQENAYENFVWKMAAILSRPQCVNKGALIPSHGSSTFTWNIYKKNCKNTNKIPSYYLQPFCLR